MPKYDIEKPDELDIRIVRALVELGVPFAPCGFRYLRCMTRCISESPEEAELVTKILYPRVAKKFKTKPTTMFSAAKRAIQVAYRQNMQNMPADFYDEDGRPLVVSAFVKLLAQKIRDGEL